MAEAKYHFDFAGCCGHQHQGRIAAPAVTPFDQMGRYQVRVARPAFGAKCVLQARECGKMSVHLLLIAVKARPAQSHAFRTKSKGGI